MNTIISIDKLKICYRLNLTSELHKLQNNPIDEFECPEWNFKLRRVDGNHFDFIYEIIYLEYSDNEFKEFKEQVFGKIQWGLRSDKNDALQSYVWLNIDNKQFYLKYDYQTMNRLPYLDYIESALGLEFNNITHLDLALDASTNFSKALVKMIRNKDYYPIINGTKITDRKKLIEDILYIGIGNLERIKEYNILIQQKDNDITVCAYNKKREIEHKSNKSYIMEVNNNPKQLHRLEVRIKSDAMKNFFDDEQIKYKASMLYDNNWLWLIYLTYLNRVIRFQEVKSKKSYNVIELI